MAFKRSAVRSRLSPPKKTLKPQRFQGFSFFLRGESVRFSNTFLTALHRQFGADKKCPPRRGGHFLSVHLLSDVSSGGFSGRDGVSDSFSVMVGIKALASFPCPRRLI